MRPWPGWISRSEPGCGLSMWRPAVGTRRYGWCVGVSRWPSGTCRSGCWKMPPSSWPPRTFGAGRNLTWRRNCHTRAESVASLPRRAARCCEAGTFLRKPRTSFHWSGTSRHRRGAEEQGGDADFEQKIGKVTNGRELRVAGGEHRRLGSRGGHCTGSAGLEPIFPNFTWAAAQDLRRKPPYRNDVVSPSEMVFQNVIPASECLGSIIRWRRI